MGGWVVAAAATAYPCNGTIDPALVVAEDAAADEREVHLAATSAFGLLDGSCPQRSLVGRVEHALRNHFPRCRP